NSSTGGVEVGKLSTEGNQIQIKVPGLERGLKLKAGQAYDPQTDSITENKVRPGRSEAEVSGTIGTRPDEEP
ncbi:MAG TPA: hypothetical protein VEA37_04245, partial [Flavobacterium sp.]|nr:hypothetical protein [Flavobacterium sp.]